MIINHVCPEVKKEHCKETPYDYLTYRREKGLGIKEERTGLYLT